MTKREWSSIPHYQTTFEFLVTDYSLEKKMHVTIFSDDSLEVSIATVRIE